MLKSDGARGREEEVGRFSGDVHSFLSSDSLLQKDGKAGRESRTRGKVYSG